MMKRRRNKAEAWLGRRRIRNAIHTGAWLFLVGSVVGFLLEGIWSVLRLGYWENHSATVWGPFCIVYGVGAVVVYAVSHPLSKRNIILQFFAFALLGATVELCASLFQQWVFSSRSWDYSAHTLNLGGHISLFMSLIWGALGVLFIRFLFPILLRAFRKIQTPPWKRLCACLSVYMALNLLVTAAAILRWHERTQQEPPSNGVECYLDSTYGDEIMERIFANMHFTDTKEES